MATDPTKMFESDSDWDKVYDFDKVSLQKKKWSLLSWCFRGS